MAGRRRNSNHSFLSLHQFQTFPSQCSGMGSGGLATDSCLWLRHDRLGAGRTAHREWEGSAGR